MKMGWQVDLQEEYVAAFFTRGVAAFFARGNHTRLIHGAAVFRDQDAVPWRVGALNVEQEPSQDPLYNVPPHVRPGPLQVNALARAMVVKVDATLHSASHQEYVRCNICRPRQDKHDQLVVKARSQTSQRAAASPRC